MNEAKFTIDSCVIGDIPMPIPAVKLVKISIEGGVFSYAYTGHDTDSTNASLRIEGQTEATLALPIVGGVWDARVFYSPDAPDYLSLTVSPEATHDEDVPGASFHTLRREYCDVVYEYVKPKLETPKNLWATINAEGDGIFCSWNYVYGANTYVVEFTNTGNFIDAGTVVTDLPSISFITGSGSWSVRVRAESPDYEASDWSEIEVVTIAEPEVVDPALVDLVLKLELALESWREEHNVIL